MTHTDNAKYVERGAGLVVKHDPGWEKDLKDANRHKEGAPFLYAEGMIMAAAALRTALMIPYRQLSGMFGEMLRGMDSPCYTTIFRRMQKLDVDIAEHIITVRDKSNNLVMIADATGLKQHNRGEWIRKKWKVRRGFVKMHLMVDADTKQVLAVSVTSEAVGDSTELPALLEEAARSIKKEEEQDCPDIVDTIKSIKKEEEQDCPDIVDTIKSIKKEEEQDCPDIVDTIKSIKKEEEQDCPDIVDTIKSIKKEEEQDCPDIVDTIKSIKKEEEQDCPDIVDTIKIPNMLADGRSPLDMLGTGEDQITPGKILLADGAYGSRKNVAECYKYDVMPLIRLLTSCTARGKGAGDKWGRLVRWQLGGGPEVPVGNLSKEERQENLRYWKSTVGFGSRWIVEIVISAIKRMFGEDVKALKWSNIVQEVKLRIWLYNKWIAEAVTAM